MSDIAYREAVRRRGRRVYQYGLPVRIGLMPLRPLRLWRWWFKFGLTRDYLPVMANLPGDRRWYTVAHWHRLALGPVVVLWRTEDPPATTLDLHPEEENAR